MSRHIVPGTTRPLDTSPPHKLSPEYRTPGLAAPCGRHAARSRMSVLASCGSHPACRCVRLVLRPQAVCVDRATGIVALLPFHVPAVPFAAAVIPPHCSVAAACPYVFTPGQAAQRCALRAPRLLSPPWTLSPPRGRVRRFCSGAAARAGERLQNKAGEVSPDPSYCAREACRRRNPPQSVIAQFQAPFTQSSRLSRRQASRAPLSASLPSDARSAQA